MTWAGQMCPGMIPVYLLLHLDAWLKQGWSSIRAMFNRYFLHKLKLRSHKELLLKSQLQVCTPSRAALLTGMYPYHLGRQHRALKPLRAGGIPTSFTLLPQLLKEKGYSTHMIGKWHLGYCAWEYTPTRRGFDTFYGTYLGVLDHWTHTRDKYDGYDFRRDEEMVYSASGVYSTDLYTQEALSLIESKQNSSDPFFLYLPYQALHAPLQVPRQYVDLVPDSVTDPERRVYLAMLAAIDDSTGQVVESLKVNGLYNNTIIVFTTDNGGSLSHAGSNYPLR